MNKDFSYYLSEFFKNYLPLEINASSNTIRSYKKTFELLVDYLINVLGWKLKDITFNNLTRDIIINFLNYLEQEKKNSIRTRNQRLGAIKSLYQYILIYNPDNIYNIKQILSIKNKKCENKKQDFLTINEVKQIFDSIDTTTKIGRRNLTILCLLYDSGARADEITNLKLEDIRIEENLVILNGKGKKQRIVAIMSSTMDMLKMYIKESNIVQGYLFHNNTGKRTNFIFKIILSVTKDLDIDKKISPHTFRRSRATHLLEAKVPLIYIKDMLGHSSIETTMQYLKISNKYKEEAIEIANKELPKTNINDWTMDKTLLSHLINL